MCEFTLPLDWAIDLMIWHCHSSCNRLGLVPIAYLWERDQEELLDEMIAAGMDCILLKVAGAGYVSSPSTRLYARMTSVLRQASR